MSVSRQLIVIGGPPGSGKTALAGRLVLRTGWPLLAKDAIKESLFDTLGTGDGAWSRRLSDASFELMFRLAAAAFGAAPVLMIEGNFRPGHGPRIAQLASAVQAQVLQVSLHAAPAVLESRLKARAECPERHPGHRDAELATTVPVATATGDLLRLGAELLEFDSSALDGPWLDAIAGQIERQVGRRAMC